MNRYSFLKTPHKTSPVLKTCEVFLGIFLIGMLYSHAQDPIPTMSMEQDSSELAGANSYTSLLWEISGKSLDKPSYLYGTIHIIPEDSFFVNDIVEEKMKEADRLVMEVVLDAASMMSSAMSMMLRPPNSLKKLLGESDYMKLTHFMRDSMPMQMPMYQMIKPIFIDQQITTSICIGSQVASYELHFMEVFKEMNKPSSGLESIKEQMQFLDDIPLEEQCNSLMETVRKPRENCAQYSEMVRLYRKENLDSLMIMMEGLEEMEAYSENLLDNRNQNWISQIEEMAADEQLFIAVGAAHLPGKQGVIELLRAKGYTVRPL